MNTNRPHELLKFITKDKKGIEIGPWFNPAAPKSCGYNISVMDVFPTNVLIERASNPDFLIPKEKIELIEEVDIIASSTQIEDVLSKKGLLGSFDYIISSHNFEHLPNPILFLQGCGKSLKPGGTLSMAIPDKRACFDHYRPHTTLSSILEAYINKREYPTPFQIFDETSNFAWYLRGNEKSHVRKLDENPINYYLKNDIIDCYTDLLKRIRNRNNEYIDTHCWTFTPCSLELILTDLNYLGLSPFEIISISKTNGSEFYVHLKNSGHNLNNSADRTKNRLEILQKVNDEISQYSTYAIKIQEELKQKKIELALHHETIEEHSHAIKKLRSELDLIYRSKSWKITRPLRTISKALYTAIKAKQKS